MHRRVALGLAALSVLVPGCALLDGGDVGSRAQAYLTGTGALIVEIDIVNGAEPNADALSTFTSAMQQATGRTVTVEKSGGLQGRGADHAYTLSELNDLAGRSAATRAPGVDVMHVLYLEGTMNIEGNTDVVGVAFSGENIAVAKGKVRQVSCAPGEELPVVGTCPNGQPKELPVERAVIVHEGGHLLGLVNVGTPMVRPHEDPQNPGHSRFDDSVMYWAVDQGNAIVNLFTGGSQIPFQFDEYDREDLRAAREGS